MEKKREILKKATSKEDSQDKSILHKHTNEHLKKKKRWSSFF